MGNLFGHFPVRSGEGAQVSLEKLHPYRPVIENVLRHLTLNEWIHLRRVSKIHLAIVDRKLATLEAVDIGQFVSVYKNRWQDKTSQVTQIRMIEKTLPSAFDFFAEKSPNVRFLGVPHLRFQSTSSAENVFRTLGRFSSLKKLDLTDLELPENIRNADLILELLQSIGPTLDVFRPPNFLSYADLCSIFQLLGNLRFLSITESQVANAAEAFLPNAQTLASIDVALNSETEEAAISMLTKCGSLESACFRRTSITRHATLITNVLERNRNSLQNLFWREHKTTVPSDDLNVRTLNAFGQLKCLTHLGLCLPEATSDQLFEIICSLPLIALALHIGRVSGAVFNRCIPRLKKLKVLRLGIDHTSAVGNVDGINQLSDLQELAFLHFPSTDFLYHCDLPLRKLWISAWSNVQLPISVGPNLAASLRHLTFASSWDCSAHGNCFSFLTSLLQSGFQKLETLTLEIGMDGQGCLCYEELKQLPKWCPELKVLTIALAFTSTRAHGRPVSRRCYESATSFIPSS